MKKHLIDPEEIYGESDELEIIDYIVLGIFGLAVAIVVIEWVV